jgi:transcriptional regulator with XRE-family HTH domain
MVKKDPYVRKAAEVIQELMDRQGVSRSDLASRLNVSTSYVYQVLSPDYGTSSHSTLERFANALGSTLAVTVTPLPIQESKGPGKLTPKKEGGKKDV